MRYALCNVCVFASESTMYSLGLTASCRHRGHTRRFTKCGGGSFTHQRRRRYHHLQHHYHSTDDCSNEKMSAHLLYCPQNAHTHKPHTRTNSALQPLFMMIASRRGALSGRLPPHNTTTATTAVAQQASQLRPASQSSLTSMSVCLFVKHQHCVLNLQRKMCVYESWGT